MFSIVLRMLTSFNSWVKPVALGCGHILCGQCAMQAEGGDATLEKCPCCRERVECCTPLFGLDDILELACGVKTYKQRLQEYKETEKKFAKTLVIRKAKRKNSNLSAETRAICRQVSREVYHHFTHDLERRQNDTPRPEFLYIYFTEEQARLFDPSGLRLILDYSVEILVSHGWQVEQVTNARTGLPALKVNVRPQDELADIAEGLIEEAQLLSMTSASP